MTNISVLVFVLVFLVYQAARQFMAQRVNLLTLLLLPVLSAYASYTELVPAFAHYSPALLTIGLAFGALAGLATGIFRGRNTAVRLSEDSGLAYAKPALASSLTWLGLLVVRVAVIALSYSSLRHDTWVGILTAFASALFLVNVVAQKWMVYVKYALLPENPPLEDNKDAA